MRKTVTFFLILIMLFSLLTSTAASSASTFDIDTVDVILTLDDSYILNLDIDGEYFIAENSCYFEDGSLVITRNSDLMLTVTHSKEGFLFAGKNISLMRKDISPDAGGIMLDGKLLLGHLLLSASSSSFNAINRVHISHYLYCTVNSAMPDYFPLEALKAQAIATKSRAMASFSKNDGIFSISDRADGLAYKGYNKNAQNTVNAVDSTLSEALYFNSNILNCEYCISNGGETALAQNQAEAYAVLEDEYDASNPNSRVEKISFTLGEDPTLPTALSEMLIKKASSQLDCTISSILHIYSASPHSPAQAYSQRSMTRCLFTLKLLSDDGKIHDNVHLDIPFSYAFGFLNRYLTAFWGETKDSVCTIYHARQGDGAGLSMRGAQQRALCGRSYKDILAFYYPAAAVDNLKASPVSNVKAPSPASKPSFTTVKATGDVYFRTGPSKKYDIITVVKKGTKVNVYSTQNGWAFGVYEDTAGYVSMSYLDIEASPTATVKPTATPTVKPTAAPTVKPTAAPTVKPTVTPTAPVETADPIGWGAVSGDAVNFRSGPSVSYTAITQLNSGTKLTIYSKVGNFYYAYVPSLDILGYISTSYVTFFPTVTGSPTAQPQVSPTPNMSGTKFEFAKGTTNDEVNFRTKPDTQNSVVIEKLPANTAVNILGKSGSWYYILVNNRTGFVNRDYITVKSNGSTGINEVPSTLTLIATSTTAAVNMRHAPSTTADIIRKLAAGDKLTVYLIQGDWCLVKQGDDYGYVYKDYVRLI